MTLFALANMTRIFLAIPIWILFILFRTIVILIGWITVPLSALFKLHYRTYDQAKAEKKENPYVYHFSWKLMYPWDNDEDGIANDMYYKAPNLFLQIIYWSCVRNPANNLRYVPILGARLYPKKIKFIGSFGSHPKSAPAYDVKHPLWFFCWCGFYSNVCVLFNMGGVLYKFRLGWKIHPIYINGIPPVRLPRAGFAIQFKKV